MAGLTRLACLTESLPISSRCLLNTCLLGPYFKRLASASFPGVNFLGGVTIARSARLHFSQRGFQAAIRVLPHNLLAPGIRSCRLVHFQPVYLIVAAAMSVS